MVIVAATTAPPASVLSTTMKLPLETTNPIPLTNFNWLSPFTDVWDHIKTDLDSPSRLYFLAFIPILPEPIALQTHYILSLVPPSKLIYPTAYLPLFSSMSLFLQDPHFIFFDKDDFDKTGRSLIHSFKKFIVGISYAEGTLQGASSTNTNEP